MLLHISDLTRLSLLQAKQIGVDLIYVTAQSVNPVYPLIRKRVAVIEIADIERHNPHFGLSLHTKNYCDEEHHNAKNSLSHNSDSLKVEKKGGNRRFAFTAPGCW